MPNTAAILEAERDVSVRRDLALDRIEGNGATTKDHPRAAPTHHPAARREEPWSSALVEGVQGLAPTCTVPRVCRAEVRPCR